MLESRAGKLEFEYRLGVWVIMCSVLLLVDMSNTNQYLAGKGLSKDEV